MASNFYSPTLISSKSMSPHRFISPNSPSRSSFRKPFNVLEQAGIRVRPSGANSFRVSAVSGGGDGGSGGGNGGGGGGGGGGGDGGGNFNKLIAWYLHLLEKYPVRTKAATSALLNLFGDVVCQVVIDKAPSLDFKRTARFTLLGFCLVGPTLHFWYLYLSKLVTVPGASGAAMRLVLDQFVFAPMFIGAFFHWINDTRRKATTSYSEASTGMVLICHSELATVDTFSISQLPFCTTTASGPCFELCCSCLERIPLV